MRSVFELRRQIFGNVSQEVVQGASAGIMRPHGTKFKVSELGLKVWMIASPVLSITHFHAISSLNHIKSCSRTQCEPQTVRE